MARRLSAILAADIVGYSHLIDLNEEETVERLKNLYREIVHPEISKRRGRTVKLMGDGLLAEFSSVVTALDCAIAIQEALPKHEATVRKDQRFRLRIGLNLGDVIVAGSDIYGDGVNIAARLESLSEPGGISLSGLAYDALAGKRSNIFRDSGLKVLKNIDRPIRVWQWVGGNHETTWEEAALSGKARSFDQPTVAVIPFSNFSSDVELDYIADSLAEDIISLLAKTPGFFVLGRYSTRDYRDDKGDPRKIGQELGAHYIVRGALRPMGEQLRVTVQLIEMPTGTQLWSDHFDRKRDELFTIQDEVCAGIVANLHPEIARAEVEFVDRHKIKDVNAWTFYRRGGTALFRHGFNRRGFDDAAQFYRKSIDLDPGFALAHAALSLTLAIGHILGFVKEPDEAAIEAERALDLTNNDSEVLGFAGCAIADLGDTTRGIDLLKRAIELNPSNPQAWTALGGALLRERKFEDAAEMLRRGMRLSPRDPRLAVWGGMLALALGALGLNEEGVVEAQAACRRDPKLHNPRVVLAYLLLKTDQTNEATAALADARRVTPELSLKSVAGIVGKKAAEEMDSIWAVVD